ncbi:MAG: thioredoxin [Clostridiales bacterium]|nr:thioredoxin [Clostridiales bacterium]
MTNNKIIILNSNNFEKEITNSKLPVLVDFWASWCGPCKMIEPFIDQLADDFHGKAKVAKVNVDEETSLASKFGVMTIPTLILFNNGRIVDKMTGVHPKADLVKFVQSAL